MRNQKYAIVIVFVFVLLFVSSFSKNLYAGENWEFTLTPYIWMVSMKGDMTVKGQTSDVDLSFSDFLDDLKFAAEVHFEATRKKGPRLGFWLDGTYVKLESDANIGPINLVIQNQFVILEGAFFLNLDKWILGRNSNSLNGNLNKPYISLDAFAGARYWYLDAELDFKGQGPIGVSGDLKADQQWVDPFIGLRSLIYLTDRFRMTLRTDFGGFDIGSASDFSWLGQVLFLYSITERIDAVIGYRALYIDYDDGSGNDKFAMDVWLQNPLIGFTFHF